MTKLCIWGLHTVPFGYESKTIQDANWEVYMSLWETPLVSKKMMLVSKKKKVELEIYGFIVNILVILKVLQLDNVKFKINFLTLNDIIRFVIFYEKINGISNMLEGKQRWNKLVSNIEIPDLTKFFQTYVLSEDKVLSKLFNEIMSQYPWDYLPTWDQNFNVSSIKMDIKYSTVSKGGRMLDCIKVGQKDIFLSHQ